MVPQSARTSWAAAALADAAPVSLWLDDKDRPEAAPPLTGTRRCDLVVVGGGYSGLWTALLAKQRDPSREVILLEGRTIGWAASGRNGGFCSSSLTHGQSNGMSRYPHDMPRLEQLGRENLAGIIETVEKFGIACDLEHSGELTVATEPYQLEDLQDAYRIAQGFGDDVTLLDQGEIHADIHSPTYVGGLWDRDSTVMVNPARLAWGLADACRSLGVTIFEHSYVDSLVDDGNQIMLTTAHGAVRADRVALGTNVFPSLVKRVRPYIIPVYDYAIATEPLSPAQMESIGWSNRQGVGDSGNQFHYYRLAADNSILFGGYDAIYHFAGRIDEALTQRPLTFTKLSEHFFDTFPQLEGVRFTHQWGGVIDTCSRFYPFFGSAYGGRVSYAVGYTGLGVGATRFGAQVMLDRLAGVTSDRTELKALRSTPIPFPPEPIKSAAVQVTRWSIARADANEGKRNLWLRTLDRFGLGFDS
ncbi:MAG: FAD-dependent oxidoreductase [Nakamurella sp.]